MRQPLGTLPAIAAQQIPLSGLTVDCIAFLNIFGANVTSTLGMAALRRVQIGRFGEAVSR